MLSLPLGWRVSPDCFKEPDLLETPAAACPRGRITEIVGLRSSGRTSLLYSILTTSTKAGETAVLVDSTDSFDPCSAAAAGVNLDKLIWIRCSSHVDHAMRAADLVIHSGGFGVIALDLADASEPSLNRIPSTTWFRWRRAIESTSTVLAVIASRPLTKSCSALLLETRRRQTDFKGNLLRAVAYELTPRKPIGKEGASLRCAAV
jgi:hypothetical protein